MPKNSARIRPGSAPLSGVQPAQLSSTEAGQSPQSLAPEDEFHPVPGSTPARQEIVRQADLAVQNYQLMLAEKQRARLIADAVVSCLTPFFTPKGVFEDQVGLFLLKVLGKIDSERREQDMEATEMERLRRAIRYEQDKLSDGQKQLLQASLSKLEKTGETLKNRYATVSEEENRILSGFSSVLSTRHQAIMTCLREMRES